MTRETPQQGDSHSGGKGARAVFLRNGAEVSTVVQSLLGSTSIPKEHAEDDCEVLGDEVGQEGAVLLDAADLLEAFGGEPVLAVSKGLFEEGQYLVCEVLTSEWEDLLRHFGLRDTTIYEPDQGARGTYGDGEITNSDPDGTVTNRDDDKPTPGDIFDEEQGLSDGYDRGQ